MPGTGSQRRGRVSYRWPQEERFSARTVILGSIGAVVIGLVVVMVSSMVLRVTAVDEKVLDYVADLGSFIGLGLVTFMVGKRVGSRGLLYGASIGLAYGVVCVLMALALPFSRVQAGRVLLRVLLLVLVGAAGSVLGVNL